MVLLDQVEALTSARLHLAGYDLSQELFKAAYAAYAEDYKAEQSATLPKGWRTSNLSSQEKRRIPSPTLRLAFTIPLP